MTQLKTNILYKISLFFALLLCSIIGVAQKYTYKGIGNWNESANWDPTPDAQFLAGYIDVEGYNISIEGNVTIPSDGLNIVDVGEIIVTSGYILDIWGGVSISAPNFVLHVQLGGFFVVHGPLNVASVGKLELDVNGGYLSVQGSVRTDGTISGPLNGSPHVYITGAEETDYFDCDDPSSYTVGPSGTCNYGDRTAIINNETDPEIRKLLLGDIPLSATITPTSPTCNGDNDGQLEIQGVGGSFYYQYSIDGGLSWQPSSPTVGSHTFTGLDADVVYNVQILDDFGDTHSESTSIDEKPELTLSVNGNPYFCDQSDVVFTVTPSGGNAPYMVSVTGQADQNGSGPGFTFSGLSAGDYTITVNDDKNCDPVSGSITVQIDNQDPTFTNFPPDVQMTYANYVSIYSPKSGVTAENDGTLYTLDNNNDVLEYTVNLSNYADPTLSFEFTVNGTPDDGDIIRVLYRFDAGDSYAELQEFTNVSVSPLTVGLPLNGLPSNNTYVDIRIETEFSTSGLTYTFNNFEITADEVFRASNPIDGGSPGCNDNLSGCIGVPTYTDNPPTWVCNTDESKEFYFQRTWHIEDVCGNSDTRPQLISVGAPPFFEGFETSNPDRTLGFCDDERTITITAPTVNDVCTPNDVDITWEVDKSESVFNGTDNIEDFPFVVGETTTITWTATDYAGLSYSEVQTVTVRSAIDVEFSYSPHAGSDICVIDDYVDFSLDVTGGSGSYYTYVYTPAGGTTGGDATSGTPTYSTNGLTQLVNFLTVTITDSDGCTSEFQSDVFNVHDRIVTGPIIRD